jgi:hypothetical protein
MSKPSKKSTSKKPTVVVLKKRNGKANALHEKLIKLFSRPNGATLTDTWECGYKYPAVQALRIAERHGYKTNVVKKSGELTRYVATKR